MATLTGNAINTSYQGIIKTLDNGAVDPTVLKQLSDGVGGSIPISVSQIETKFASGSIVDFTGATVNGISAGGVAAGTGLGSLQSVVPGATGNASSSNSIAIGVDAAMSGGFGAAIGVYSEAGGNYANAFGSLCNASATNSLAVGKQAAASAAQAISIGIESNCSNQNGIAIGNNAVAQAISGDGSVVIGWNTKTVRDAGVAIGRNLNQLIGSADHYRPINIGSGGNVRGGDVIGIGTNVDIQGPNTNDKIAIGNAAIVTDVAGAVALGAGVTASKANTVSVKELETTVNGGGIIMHSPNGTEYKLTVSDAGALVITAV